MQKLSSHPIQSRRVLLTAIHIVGHKNLIKVSNESENVQVVKVKWGIVQQIFVSTKYSDIGCEVFTRKISVILRDTLSSQMLFTTSEFNIYLLSPLGEVKQIIQYFSYYLCKLCLPYFSGNYSFLKLKREETIRGNTVLFKK